MPHTYQKLTGAPIPGRTSAGGYRDLIMWVKMIGQRPTLPLVLPKWRMQAYTVLCCPKLGIDLIGLESEQF